MVSLLRPVLFMVTMVIACLSSAAAEPTRVLWWDVSLHEPRNTPDHRNTMAQYLSRYKNGTRFAVNYQFEPAPGAFARFMAGNSDYQILILSAANDHRVFNTEDQNAFAEFYASGARALMLDGTLGVRNSDVTQLTKWPGVNNASANMLVNQLEALRQAGGGVLIGTDHGAFQASANLALQAILPQARFSRITNPSRDGAFLGTLLLATEEPVKPLDMLKHWEAIPNQGQAPAGRYTDVLGNSIMLYTLIEASDKPGGLVRRPYISTTIAPDQQRFDIDADTAPIIDRMPTRQGPPQSNIRD